MDYRTVTRKDAYALPRIDDTLDALAGSKWFSTLDLASGYWQVGMHPDDREKTAFCTADGLFEFNVMPFGLCNASCSNISTPYGPDFGWPKVVSMPRIPR